MVIITGNPQSTVYINNEEVGTGDTIKTITKKGLIKQLIVKTPKYKDEYYCLIPLIRNAAFWALQPLNICNLFIGISIDGMLAKKYNTANKIPPLTNYKYRTTDSKYIYLSDVKFDIKDKKKNYKTFTIKYSDNVITDANNTEKEKNTQDEADAQKSIKKKGHSTGNKLIKEDNEIRYTDTTICNALNNIIKKSGYVDTVSKIFSANNNTLVLEASINNICFFNISHSKKGIAYHKAKVYSKWYIKNTYNEILDSILTQNFSGDFMGYYNYTPPPTPTSTTNNSDAYANYYNNYITKMINNNHVLNQKEYLDALTNSYLSLFDNENLKKYLKQDTDYRITEPLLSIDAPKQTVQEVGEATEASVTVKTKDGHGSGFAISQDGYILTNFHVIAGKYFGKLNEVKVILSNGEELPAQVIRYSRYGDIALLKVENKFNKAFLLSNNKTFKNFQEVYAIGTPKSVELGQSISKGIISNERKTNNNDILQLSMSVNAGNSGSPLFDKTGVLHGVIVSKLIGWSTEGVSFAVPSYLKPDYLNINYK